MIIITGVDRSGTSLVAALYRDLGFDPGGTWFPETSSGLEDPGVVQANSAIIWDLGMLRSGRLTGTALHVRDRGPVALASAAARRAGKGVLPPSLHGRARNALLALYRLRREVDRFQARSFRTPSLARWERLDAVVSARRAALHELAGARSVVKDPRFLWALHVWAAAGVPIEHVVVCVRAMEASLRSRARAGFVQPPSLGAARNWFAYGLGLAFAALHEYRIEHSIIRFPDFLSSPEELYGRLRFPRPVSEEEFRRAFVARVDQDLVHDWR